MNVQDHIVCDYPLEFDMEEDYNTVNDPIAPHPLPSDAIEPGLASFVFGRFEIRMRSGITNYHQLQFDREEIREFSELHRIKSVQYKKEYDQTVLQRWLNKW